MAAGESLFTSLGAGAAATAGSQLVLQTLLHPRLVHLLRLIKLLHLLFMLLLQLVNVT